MKLEGSVAIVTGAARGIGQTYTLRLVAEGANVVAADVLDCSETAKLAGANSDRVLPVRVDVTDYGSVEGMVEAAMERFGRVDTLVNNAALFGNLKRQPAEEIPLDEWDTILSINVKGVFLCCRAVLPIMREQGSGRIINVSSGTVFRATANLAHYIASKGAVTALTKALAVEWGQYGILVNAIAPGHTMSEMVRGRMTEEQVQRTGTGRAIARPEVPEDLAGTIVFLASADSAFITGQTFVVDGGAVMR